MNGVPDTLSVEWSAARGHSLRDFVALGKPRVVAMVLATTLVGFYLGAPGAVDYVLLLQTLLGTGLAAGGTLALNQYIEHDLDACMHRTRGRPLPSGRLTPAEALAFGAILTVVGLSVLGLRVNVPSAMVTSATVATYLFCYTPLKVRTPLCSVVGAIAGALPPVTGWVAARGDLCPGAWALFAILFLWQLPHSLAIAKLHTEDYARAGFRLLPVVDRDGFGTERHIVSSCTALLPVGLMPTWFGLTGVLYFFCALFFGMGFLWCGLSLAWTQSPAASRRVLFASLVYLPLLLAVMAVDKISW